MIPYDKKSEVKEKITALYEKAHIILTDDERDNIEITDMGLNDIDKFGLSLVTYINTDRVCAKEMALLPNQTCPEHRHPPLGSENPGKEETFRCRYGTVYLCVDIGQSDDIENDMPQGSVFTARHRIVLKSGEQYTIPPNTRHWFRAGDRGAVVSEFSTHSSDETDIFTDKNIVRV